MLRTQFRTHWQSLVDKLNALPSHQLVPSQNPETVPVDSVAPSVPVRMNLGNFALKNKGNIGFRRLGGGTGLVMKRRKTWQKPQQVPEGKLVSVSIPSSTVASDWASGADIQDSPPAPPEDM